ncbi:ABC transporter substrate-binding protein [Nisaea sp.]|uniref:ABC transporter substrate-binding protein n=1 Tax=Nisaea sp. TaxID=2024842 RepID=UPI0032979445
MCRFQRLIFVFGGLFFLFGCSEPEPIRIGFIADFEGRASELGISGRNAVQLAVDEVNAAGGINGRTVELLVRDDMSTKEGGANAARSLVTAQVRAIIGPIRSVVAGGVVPIINEAEIVTVSPTVLAASLVGKDDHFFRMASSSRKDAEHYARRLYAEGYNKIAVASDANNELFTGPWVETFRAEFEKNGGTVTASIPFDAGNSKGLSATVAALLKAQTDAVLVLANGIDTAQIAQQIKKTNEHMQLLATSWSASENLVVLGGRAAEGMLLGENYDRNDTSAQYVRFRDAFTGLFGVLPSQSSITSYDAAQILFAAMRNTDGAADLKSKLLGIRGLKGLQQEIGFDGFGDGDRALTLVVVKDGEFIRK